MLDGSVSSQNLLQVARLKTSVLLTNTDFWWPLAVFVCDLHIIEFVFPFLFSSIQSVVSVLIYFFVWFLLCLRTLLVIHSHSLWRIGQRTYNPIQLLFRKIFDFHIFESFFFRWQIRNGNYVVLLKNMIPQLALLCCARTRLILKWSSDSVSSKWSPLTIACSSDFVVSVSSIWNWRALENFEVVKRLDLYEFNAIVCVWMKPNDRLQPCWLNA